MKFRKKPVVIEAEQYRPVDFDGKPNCPKGVCICTPGGVVPHVHTIHNGQAVKIESRDWIIPEPDGKHFYPVKPDIFEATYERIND